ncbi:hypothetical protein G6F31_018749 [Rhizopus arrhizus]|nr:hypothetical protein G6F31_018749 [Rhizopus arrhizus]
MDQLDQPPGLQLFQAQADIRTRKPEGFGNGVRVQRFGVQEQQGVDLADGAVHAPTAAHFAKVQHETFVLGGKNHEYRRQQVRTAVGLIYTVTPLSVIPEIIEQTVRKRKPHCPQG